MADLTLKLIWYRLGETYSKMAEAGANAQSWFSWEEHFLDFLLIFWISAGLLIVGVCNSLTTFFGPLQPRISWDKSKDGASSNVVSSQGPHSPEATQWLNSALNWFYLHYEQFPQFVGAWVQSLNEQAVKLGGPVQLRFEKVQSGSLPPKFGEVTHDAGPDDIYILNCRVDSRDLSFAVFASQQTHDGVKLTNLNVTVLKLRGQLKIRCFRQDKDMMAEVSFSGRPDIKVQGKPVNPYMDPSDMVDVGVVQEVVRNTICLASTTFNISQWINSAGNQQTLGDQQISPVRRTVSSEPAENRLSSGSAPQSPRQTQPPVQQIQPQQVHQQQQQQQQQQQKIPQQQTEVFEAMDAPQQQTSAFHVPTLQTPTKSAPQRVPAARGAPDQRLLVKVIKASGLKQNEGQVDPYCVMYVDTPPQTEVTNIVRSTFNPFWDEQFYFDLNRDSQEIRFEVLDKRRNQNESFLGEAVVYVEDLQRNPSSRQIIPLQGRPGVREFVAGSLTVELLCMEGSDAVNAVSPRRTIETSKEVTPGGTVVTTMTTTTQKPQNSRYDTTIDGSPSYIEKKSFDYNTSSSPEAASSAFYSPITTESTPVDEGDMSRMSVPPSMSSPESPEINYPPQVKERKSFAARIKKRFSRSKKRSLSADRATSSLREGSNYLQPPGPHSKDDIDLHKVKRNEDTPNLKKSRSLGGSLKKLFRRSRKRSRSQGRGEQSRESSLSRQSRHTSQGPSREGSLTRSSYNPSQQDTVIL